MPGNFMNSGRVEVQTLTKYVRWSRLVNATLINAIQYVLTSSRCVENNFSNMGREVCSLCSLGAVLSWRNLGNSSESFVFSEDVTDDYAWLVCMAKSALNNS